MRLQNSRRYALMQPVHPEYSVVLDSTGLTILAWDRVRPCDSGLATKDGGTEMGILRMVLAVLRSFASRAALAAENVMLRQQLLVLQRSAKRPQGFGAEKGLAG